QLVLRSQLPDNANHIDSKLMRHILTNLLSNAINYSPSGGEIILGLETIDDHIQIWVRDHGIGIPEEARDTLFESFVRGSNVGTISGTDAFSAGQRDLMGRTVDLPSWHHGVGLSITRIGNSREGNNPQGIFLPSESR
ncbi:MAG: sensor histidine kinase, partial [Okeania sp. SIO1H5]|uniref:sensor histidine kinase n=1 Tax=Okeania sp. SIO1H5 TaxID=2607777 RepID=UPI0013B62B30